VRHSDQKSRRNEKLMVFLSLKQMFDKDSTQIFMTAEEHVC
jgi:hypothetical protein